MHKARRLSLVYLLSACLPLTALAEAVTWRSQLPAAKLLGSGDLRWFGFHIYSAKLWCEAPRFDVQAAFALELTYQRDIKRSRFVSVSLDEMRRLNGDRFSAEQWQRWEAYMQQAFVDVKAGDQLVGVHLPGVGCRFYSRDRLLLHIPDPQFAQAFFAIWFDARSKDQVLRLQLLGENRDG